MSEPIRVLHIVTHMNRGGLETMIMNYYRHIDRDKIQFDFLTHRDGVKDYDEEIKSLGGKIYHLPPLNPFSLSYRKALKEFFKQHSNYKIVHCHLDCMSAIPLKYAKKSGIKNRIAHSHNTSQEQNLKFILKLFYKNLIPYYATQLYSCGIEAGKWMFKNKNFYVLNNAIEAEKYTYDENISIKLKKEYNLENCFVLGHVGRFNEQKNHKFLIDLFYEFTKKNDNSRLVLIGEGELRKEIMNQVHQYNLEDKVLFLGVRNDVHILMQMMDVFVFPSLFEGLPLTLIEAQSSGLPCVISKNISDESIVTHNVIQLPLNNIDSWVNEINSLNVFKRKNTFEEIVKAGFDVNHNINELENRYMEMLI